MSHTTIRKAGATVAASAIAALSIMAATQPAAAGPVRAEPVPATGKTWCAAYRWIPSDSRTLRGRECQQVAFLADGQTRVRGSVELQNTGTKTVNVVLVQDLYTQQYDVSTCSSAGRIPGSPSLPEPGASIAAGAVRTFTGAYRPAPNGDPVADSRCLGTPLTRALGGRMSEEVTVGRLSTVGTRITTSWSDLFQVQVWDPAP